MAPSIASQLTTRPRKMLAARLNRGESGRKNFAPALEADNAEENAAIVAAVLRFSKLTPQQLGGKFGHADQSQVSRWLNRQENANVLLKLWAVRDLRPFVVLALIDVANNPLMRVRYLAEVAPEAVNA
jgi:hypothetical protein